MPNIFTNNIIWLNEVDSTQDYIKRSHSMPNCTVVVAESQTNGKGTNGRSWKTETGKNLIFSVLLTPNCHINKIKNLTLTTAHTVVSVIYKLYGYKLEIKPPNDVMLNGKKICGILTESTTQGEIVKKIIIGIGFNVNQIEFSNEIKNIATSLKKEYYKEFDRRQILEEFLYQFEKEYIKIL